MSNKRTRKNLLWITCFCAQSHAAILEDADEKLVSFIQKGNLPNIERAIRRLGRPLGDVSLVVKRRHLSTAYPCLVDHRAAGTDPFINFYQECSPVIWAMDCLQWHVLPLLNRYGCDVNRPQTCRRWTYICAPNSRPNTAPYRRFWTRGKYTYQSALDYFFASVYEFVGEQPSSYNGLSGPSPLAFYFSHLPVILSKGVDVHRIDSVIIFNSLATSYDQYLCRYTNEHATVPDIPESDDAFVEMTAVKRLIEHGFSQFECMDYLYPCCNWFGILLCLVCHPKIDSYRHNLLPSIIRQAALLLINLLALKCTLPSVEDFAESLENLHLRKVYSKRYCERREIFNDRLANLHRVCQEVSSHPLSLKVLARNAVRKQLGGINFHQKLNSIGLPPQLATFVQFIGPEQLKASHMPKQLTRLALGEFTDFSRDSFNFRSNELGENCLTSSPNRTAMVHLPPLIRAGQGDRMVDGCSTDPRQFNFTQPTSPLPMWSRQFRRDRASERHVAGPKRLDGECSRQPNDTTALLLGRPLSASLPVLQFW
ncbi:unnamed protein product [Dicrocoelium dendriticum]|nr:unnamed protein product [Dicrocoelium dendriticum]